MIVLIIFYSATGGWPEMMTFLDEAMKGANKPLGFLTLSALTDTAPEQMMPNAEYIATALMAGLQVMCHVAARHLLQNVETLFFDTFFFCHAVGISCINISWRLKRSCTHRQWLFGMKQFCPGPRKNAYKHCTLSYVLSISLQTLTTHLQIDEGTSF